MRTPLVLFCSGRTLANFKVQSETVVGWTRKKRHALEAGYRCLSIKHSESVSICSVKASRTLKRTKVAYFTRICCNILIGGIKACRNGRYLIIRPHWRMVFINGGIARRSWFAQFYTALIHSSKILNTCRCLITLNRLKCCSFAALQSRRTRFPRRIN